MGCKDDEEKKEKRAQAQQQSRALLLQVQMANAKAEAPVVMWTAAVKEERAVNTDGGRNDESKERELDGGRREPPGRMSSWLPNEQQAVETPSTLLASSFVLHSQPSYASRLPSSRLY